jgi:hypothetical protein
MRCEVERQHRSHGVPDCSTRLPNPGGRPQPAHGLLLRFSLPTTLWTVRVPALNDCITIAITTCTKSYAARFPKGKEICTESTDRSCTGTHSTKLYLYSIHSSSSDRPVRRPVAHSRIVLADPSANRVKDGTASFAPEEAPAC